VEPEEPLMSVHEVAAYLNVPVRWVYLRVQRSEIPHLRLGKHLRFQRSRVESWLRNLPGCL
jgi:excisionase family DNA binding protein